MFSRPVRVAFSRALRRTSPAASPGSNARYCTHAKIFTIEAYRERIDQGGPRHFTAISAFAALSGTFHLYNTQQDRSVTACESQLGELTNPLWPGGVSEEDIDTFVDDVLLADPTINLASIPDAIERKIYKATVKLTLNSIYNVLGQMHGTEFLAHKFQLARKANPENRVRVLKRMKDHVSVDEEILERVVDRLLENPAINQKYLPDEIERQLYVNCLKLVFYLLDTLASTFRITICGHNLSLHLEPSIESLANKMAASSSLTQVDVDALREFAKQAGLDEKDDSARGLFGYIGRLMQPVQEGLTIRLHAALYGLMLGIADDLMANTQFDILSDQIKIDIVPDDLEARAARKVVGVQQEGAFVVVEMEEAEQSSSAPMVAAFSCGLGVGASVVALLLHKS